MTNEPDDSDALRHHLACETATIRWQELQKFFAEGRVFVAGDSLDLVDIALQIAKDNKAAVASWCASGQLAKVTDQQAQQWFACDALMWAVVVKPWVIIQVRKDSD